MFANRGFPRKEEGPVRLGKAVIVFAGAAWFDERVGACCEGIAAPARYDVSRGLRCAAAKPLQNTKEAAQR